MPNDRVNQTMHIGWRTGSIEALNQASLERVGELGSRIQVGNSAYQLVKLDSGATASTGAGAVAAGDLAFWKDKEAYLVTNDKVQALGGPTVANARNSVCGVFTAAATANYYCVVQQRGTRSVRTDGGADFTANQDKIVASTNNAPDGDRNALATAPPVRLVGWVRAAESAGFTSCELDLPMDNP